MRYNFCCFNDQCWVPIPIERDVSPSHFRESLTAFAKRAKRVTGRRLGALANQREEFVAKLPVIAKCESLRARVAPL